MAEYKVDVFNALLHGLEDAETEVRLAACDFWPEFFAGSLP